MSVFLSLNCHKTVKVWPVWLLRRPPDQRDARMQRWRGWPQWCEEQPPGMVLHVLPMLNLSCLHLPWLPLLFMQGYEEEVLLFPCFMVVATVLNASGAHPDRLKLVADSTAQDCKWASFSHLENCYSGIQLSLCSCGVSNETLQSTHLA